MQQPIGHCLILKWSSDPRQISHCLTGLGDTTRNQKKKRRPNVQCEVLAPESIFLSSSLNQEINIGHSIFVQKIPKEKTNFEQSSP